MNRIKILGLAALFAALSSPALAQPLEFRVSPQGDPLTTGSVGRSGINPNVTRSNRLGVVGWDGPPGDVPSVIGDAEPLPAGHPALTSNGFHAFGR